MANRSQILIRLRECNLFPFAVQQRNLYYCIRIKLHDVLQNYLFSYMVLLYNVSFLVSFDLNFALIISQSTENVDIKAYILIDFFIAHPLNQ